MSGINLEVMSVAEINELIKKAEEARKQKLPEAVKALTELVDSTAAGLGITKVEVITAVLAKADKEYVVKKVPKKRKPKVAAA